jgi:DNA-binding SARP family transcriptional activator/DNA-binding transcriptional ArsR family regulator
MVEYFLSGAIEARVDGSVAALGGSKQRCVLAVLLANHGSVVSIDALVDAVWVDDAPPKALASVRSYVANLRRLLEATDPKHDGHRRLESRPFGYRLNLLADDSVDLHRFEQLVSTGRTALIRHDPDCAVATLSEALALWHGDPFGEFGYRDFAAYEVVRFAALRTTAIEARLDAALQAGGGADLVPDIEAAVAQHPMQERLWGHLMLALYRAGRTADAVSAFDRACSTLKQEIGSEPGEGLQTLFQKICDRSPDLHVQPSRHTIAAQPEASEPLPLLGRDSELQALTAALRPTGTGGLTLVTGESGIGKTSLALATARLGPGAGVAVAWAAHPAGIRLPLLWTWIQLLRQLGTDLGEPVRQAVRRAAPGVVNALVPEWNERDTPPSAAATGFALMEGIVTALRTLASSRSLLLILDDLQLADSTSLETLSLLAAEFPRIPIRVIGNWTFFGADRPINRQSLEVLLRSNDTTTVHLDGIDRVAAAHLVDEIANSPTPQYVSEHMWRQTGGNPFYLKELARARDAGTPRQRLAQQDPASLPEAVVGVIGRRLGVLDPPSRRVLSAAAVVGPEFDIADLSDIVELPISTVQWRLRPAYEAGLIDEVPEHPGAYRFGHGLFRDAVLAQLPIPDRTTVHAAVATTRAATLATAAYELGIAAADHAWRAGAELSPDTALEIHETVIARALTRSAYDDVAALVEHALQICARLPAKPEHLERQATLWLHLSGAKGILEGQASTAAAHAVQRALEIGREVKGRSFYSAIALQCVMLCAHGRIDEAQVIATGLRGQYDASGDPGIGVASGFAQVMVYALRGDVEALISAGQHMMDTFPPPETVTDPMHFFHPRVYCWMALGEAVRGDRDAMRDYAQRGLQLAQSRGDVFNILAAKLSFVESAAILGDITGTAAAADAVEREFNAAGGQQWGAAAKIISVWAQILETGTGDPASAFDAFEVLTADGTCAMNALFLGLLADIETHYGRTEHAHELLSRAQMLAETTGEHAWDHFIGRRLTVTEHERGADGNVPTVLQT